jgi:hypothetical protein
MHADQERWDCWILEGGRIRACGSSVAPTADVSDAAVAACKASGLDAKVARAEDHALAWIAATRGLRLVVLTSAVCALIWLGLGRRHREVTRFADGKG